MQCKELLDKIDTLSDKYLNILEDVCNIESPTSFKKGVDEVGTYFVKLAEEKGWMIERHNHDIAGDAICITLNPDAKGEPVTVSGHIDTVHPIGLFGNPPVRRDEKNMYGPGVMDCKGGVVAAFMAMDALCECGFDKRPVKLIIQTDEETGSSTSNKETLEFMKEKSKESVAFLNLEGMKGQTAVIVRKGIYRCNIDVWGKAMHSSLCTTGVNAVAEAAHKILELEKMKDADGLTCNCGVINGGTTPNTVAEHCRFTIDIRFSNDSEYNTAKKIVDDIVNKTYIDGCTAKLSIISYRPAMPYEERNQKLLDRMNEIYKANDMPVLEGRKNVSGSDAAYATQWGIPCIDSIGTEGEYIHSVREYIKLDSLKESAKRIGAVIYYI